MNLLQKLSSVGESNFLSSLETLSSPKILFKSFSIKDIAEDRIRVLLSLFLYDAGLIQQNQIFVSTLYKQFYILYYQKINEKNAVDFVVLTDILEEITSKKTYKTNPKYALFYFDLFSRLPEKSELKSRFFLKRWYRFAKQNRNLSSVAFQNNFETWNLISKLTSKNDDISPSEISDSILSVISDEDNIKLGTYVVEIVLRLPSEEFFNVFLPYDKKLGLSKEFFDKYVTVLVNKKLYSKAETYLNRISITEENLFNVSQIAWDLFNPNQKFNFCPTNQLVSAFNNLKMDQSQISDIKTIFFQIVWQNKKIDYPKTGDAFKDYYLEFLRNRSSSNSFTLFKNQYNVLLNNDLVSLFKNCPKQFPGEDDYLLLEKELSDYENQLKNKLSELLKVKSSLTGVDFTKSDSDIVNSAVTDDKNIPKFSNYVIAYIKKDDPLNTFLTLKKATVAWRNEILNISGIAEKSYFDSLILDPTDQNIQYLENSKSKLNNEQLIQTNLLNLKFDKTNIDVKLKLGQSVLDSSNFFNIYRSYYLDYLKSNAKFESKSN